MTAPGALRRGALHPATASAVLLGAAVLGAVLAVAGRQAAAVAVLALTTGAAAGFANSGST